jgi:hypothetical protein
MRRALRLIFRRAQIAEAVDDELAFHLDMRTQRLIACGMPPDAARREAIRQFGDLDSVRRDCVSFDEERERTMRRRNYSEELRQDIAYAIRTLRRNIGFSLIVVVTLALGIGANTAIFTLINAVLLRQLDVPHPEQLVAIGNPAPAASPRVVPGSICSPTRCTRRSGSARRCSLACSPRAAPTRWISSSMGTSRSIRALDTCRAATSMY